MKTRPFLIVSAVFEAAIGLTLLVSPSFPAALLLGVALNAPAARVIARVAGGALLALGLACWSVRHVPPPVSRGMVMAMLVYNIATAATFAYGGLVNGLPGIGLWPTVVLHAGMAAWGIACLRRGGAGTR